MCAVTNAHEHKPLWFRCARTRYVIVLSKKNKIKQQQQTTTRNDYNKALLDTRILIGITY